MKEKRNLLTGIGLISAFVLWTVLIQCVDVQAVGQNGTKIGLAVFNVWFHQLTGVHMTIYTITDWLGLVPIFVCLCSGMLGMVLSVSCAAVFILTRQPYAGIICLAILVVKGLMIGKGKSLK